MLTRKYLRMGIGAVLSVVLVATCPVMTFATGVDEVVVFGSGSSASDYDDKEEALDTELTDEENKYDIDEEEIWALIDRDDLRSFVDVDAVRESIDKEALLEKIDLESLVSQIDEIDLIRQVDSDKHPVDVVNVKMPIIGEDSPFDFIIDPLGLIYGTDAAKYGGGRVEEGATVLFKNTSGDYLFSSNSDTLTVVNHGNVPVRLTIKANITNPGGIDFVDSRSQLSGSEPSIFMALCDNEGIRSVMTEYGEAQMEVILAAAPDGTYSFSWNEDSDRYDYVIAEDVDEEVFDSFSFNICADCNTEGNWDLLEEVPTISVSWQTEPIEPEKDELDQEVEKYESEIEELVAKYLENYTPSISIIESKVYPTTPVTKEDDEEEILIIDEEEVPEASDASEALDAAEEAEESDENNDLYAETAPSKDKDEEKSQAELRSEKIAKLRKEALIKLATNQFKTVLEEELERLIEEEVDKLADEQFQKLKADMIKALKEAAKDAEKEVVDTTDVIDSEGLEGEVIEDEETKGTDIKETTEPDSTEEVIIVEDSGSFEEKTETVEKATEADSTSKESEAEAEAVSTEAASTASTQPE